MEAEEVRLMTPVLQVNMLGEFSMSFGDRTVNDQINRSKKLWTLLEYLIAFRDREVSQNELLELLWPNDEVDNPTNTLKTLLHRARSVIEELGFADSRKVIAYRRGTYAWAPPVSCRIDTEQFDQLCLRAFTPGLPDEERIEKLLAATDTYKGDFLPNSALDSWVVPINTYYRSQYIKAVCAAADLLHQMGRDSEIIPLCQKAVVIDPYEEYLHLSLIKALIFTGKQKQALEHYEYVTDMFYSKFGITPSEELTALYKEVVKTSKSTQMDLSVIKDSLTEHERKQGCFFCEYEFFKNVYQLEARSAARTGQVVFVCLLTLTNAHGEIPDKKVLNRAMDRLRESILRSLRRGDVFTRYSVSQFLVMLPTTTFENGEKVIQRIAKTFRKENPKAPVVLRHSLQPLSPE